MQPKHRLPHAIVLIWFASCILSAQGYTAAEKAMFAPQQKTILLLKNPSGQKPIILFQTRLRVNTDGSPLSYHPQDLLGQSKALNNICNAIAVRKTGSQDNLCLSRGAGFREAVGVFEKFRDSGFTTVPDGFQIRWENVLAAVSEQGTKKPCVFASGPFQGYFGSLTALNNGLTQNRGECDLNNQVNPIAVPALVLVGGKSVVSAFGAQLGDLLVAFNPQTGLFSSAIVNDTGPADNLGEGSVLLNMRLRGVASPPTNKQETFNLSIENAQVLVAIIPGSKSFQLTRPYSAENIDARVRQWQRDAGFASPEQFIEMIKSFAPNLK
jgi:hypothetical protein